MATKIGGGALLSARSNDDVGATTSQPATAVMTLVRGKARHLAVKGGIYRSTAAAADAANFAAVAASSCARSISA
jgi:hypothetical protein